jgi:membrane fusion protein (multidrug efflux system)
MKLKTFTIYLLVSWFAMSCENANKTENKESVEVPVLKIVEKDTTIENSFVTDIQAKKNIEIRSRISGIIENIFVNEGQFVSKASANLQQAEADIKISEIEVAQLQSLFDKNFIASNELDLAKAKLASAKARKSYMEAEKNAALQKISFTNITAPFDGVIDVIPFKEGSLLENGALLTTLSDLNEVHAYFSIPENMYFELISNNQLGKHQKIELVLPNGIKYQYDGTLKTAEGEIDRATGSIRYKVTFPNPDKLIKHGSSGKLVITELQEKSIIIPQKSTFSIQDKVYVFVLNNENKVAMKNIQVGATLQDTYIIEGGLNKGELIVYEGTQSLRDGDIVKVKSNI